MKAEHSAGAII